MPRSYASDLLVDDIDLVGERAAGRPYRSGRRRSDLFMLMLAGAGVAAVLFNALALQQGRPGSAGQVPVPASAPVDIRKVENPRAASPLAPPSAAPAQTPEAVPVAPTSLPPTPLPPSKPAAPRAPQPAATPPLVPVPLAEKAGTAASGASGMLPPGDVPVSPRIMDIQKALARLGYGPIRIDGVYGAATQEAIERFERDRRLPVTGRMSDSVIRELNAVSGFTIR